MHGYGNRRGIGAQYSGLSRQNAAMNRRNDRITAMFIDAVLDACGQHDIARAARLLREDGVPLDVALRVLTRPVQRRHDPPRVHPLVAIASVLFAPFGSAERWPAQAARARRSMQPT
jgi:hypothetical protein